MGPSQVFVLYRSSTTHTHIVGVYASRDDAQHEAERLHQGRALDWKPYAHTGLRADLPPESTWSGYYIEPAELIPSHISTPDLFLH